MEESSNDDEPVAVPALLVVLVCCITLRSAIGLTKLSIRAAAVSTDEYDGNIVEDDEDEGEEEEEEER